MGFSGGNRTKKDLNVELNLLPVFDILSVCICFLLMTVVWVEIRTLETKQAIGGQSVNETKAQASLWVSIDDKNNITLTWKSANAKESTSQWLSKEGKIDWSQAKKFLAPASAKQVGSAMILPTKLTKYDQIIRLMDLLKQNGINDVGLSPI